MNKVICDVCGTAYPETSAHCPICGCAKTSVDRTSAGDEDGYAYVKGGRFSKKNVRSRNSGTAPERVSAPVRRPQERTEHPERRDRPASAERQERPSRREPEQEEQSNTGLILVVIFLLIAIIAVVIYIGIRVFGPDDSGVPKDPGSSQITLPTGGSTNPPSDTHVPCESLKLSSATIELTAEVTSLPLQVRTVPESTTDTVTFESSDPNVATVDENGLVVAVGPGTATITVKCGDAEPVTCTVICNFGSDPQPTDPVVPEFTFEFNTKFKDGNKWDITLKFGDVWTCYKKDLSVDPGAITWTSDNPAVCTMQNGIVTIVGGGRTEIHAQYAGKTYTCIVRVDPKSVPNVDDDDPDEENPGEENPGEDTPAYTINKTDVTIKVGETFNLILKDASGNAIEVTWAAENATYVTIDGNKITGAAPGTTNVSVTYEGVTYTCIVRVNAS